CWIWTIAATWGERWGRTAPTDASGTGSTGAASRAAERPLRSPLTRFRAWWPTRIPTVSATPARQPAAPARSRGGLIGSVGETVVVWRRRPGLGRVPPPGRPDSIRRGGVRWWFSTPLARRLVQPGVQPGSGLVVS